MSWLHLVLSPSENGTEQKVMKEPIRYTLLLILIIISLESVENSNQERERQRLTSHLILFCFSGCSLEFRFCWLGLLSLSHYHHLCVHPPLVFLSLIFSKPFLQNRFPSISLLLFSVLAPCFYPCILMKMMMAMTVSINLLLFSSCSAFLHFVREKGGDATSRTNKKYSNFLLSSSKMIVRTTKKRRLISRPKITSSSGRTSSLIL